MSTLEQPDNELPHEDSTIYSDSERKRSKKSKKEKHRKHKTHRHRHHQHKTSAQIRGDNYDACEGVVHVILTEEVQRLLKCVVGEEVTAEKTWTHINKYFIQEQVESEDVPEDFHTFLKHKQFISEFPNDYMMIGYIPDESRDYDEFYLCLTLEAEEQVNEIVKEQELKQQARLENTINKRVGTWASFGSEAEIEEGKMHPTRGFYVIEFEARYPIIYPDVKFCYRLVQQARDGYAELKTMAKYLVPIVHKRRIDNSVQAAPSVMDNEAQTFCSYPKNNWTQYEYECEFVESVSKEFMQGFSNFADEKMDDIDDILHVNEDINFYSNDYYDLCNKIIPTLFEMEHQEYQSLNDVKRCKDKMITSFTWHPMWTGVVAIAYADISPKWYQYEKKDNNLMEEVVHGYNPILIWSFNDSLNPKLILETNSEVHCLSFCPQDPNILVGGCANGQIILWDIKNKLNKVETEEVLTPAQQAYRTRLFAEMAWMKNTRDYSIVPPTAFSELMNSHINNVTAIQWIHPLYKVAKTGRLQPLEEGDESPSLQFVTSSADGTIRFWDLQQKPLITGDYKPQRKSRRLGKRPSALTMDVSPYRILNRRMLPLYELQVILPDTEKLCPASSVATVFETFTYEESFPDSNRVANITDRVIYQPIFAWPKKPVLPTLVVGTYTGDFMISSWEGFEYSSGDLFSKEDIKIMNIARYHDGPVLTCQPHPKVRDVYLSIGGKIFCIWLSKLKGKPVLWRRSRNKYTHGNWEATKSYAFRFTTSEGSREFWNLDFKNDGPYSSAIYSGKPLLEGAVHPLPMKNVIVGVADDRGTLRLLYSPNEPPEDNETVVQFEKFIANNADRKTDFEDWQTKWTDKHAGWIKAQREAELAEVARVRAEALDRQAYEEEVRAKEAIEEAKRAAAKEHPPPGKYEEWARERWIVKEQERMGNELLSNKRLDKETLMRQQLPLKKQEVEATKKQQKMRQRLMKVDEIFNDTVAMLFPNLVERVTDTFKPTYTDSEIGIMHKNFLHGYRNISTECKTLVENHPFTYEFDWKQILAATKTRKLKEEFKHVDRHSDRYKKHKLRREGSDDLWQPIVAKRVRIQTFELVEEFSYESASDLATSPSVQL